MTLAELNALSTDDARNELHRCCGSSRWVAKMVSLRPFRTATELYDAAESVWQKLSPEDWKEAFSHHPKIGDLKSVQQRFAATVEWAASEQSGVEGSSEIVLQNLAEGNRLYETKFGYIFIVCAIGKSAHEMLALLQSRMQNDPATELSIAAAEQSKITRLRLEKLLNAKHA
jgi:2-oxo-4-hydroxy-4-carboxy-5-ureidoimidazoline decarboxylase